MSVVLGRGTTWHLYLSKGGSRLAPHLRRREAERRGIDEAHDHVRGHTYTGIYLLPSPRGRDERSELDTAT